MNFLRKFAPYIPIAKASGFTAHLIIGDGWDFAYIGHDPGGMFDFAGVALLLVRERSGVKEVFYHLRSFFTAKFASNITEQIAGELMSLNQGEIIGMQGDEAKYINELVQLVDKAHINLRAICCDKTKSISVKENLTKYDLDPFIINIRQGTALVAGALHLELDLQRRRASTDTKELLKSNIEAVEILPIGNNFVIQKNESTGKKIDALMALIIAYNFYNWEVSSKKISFD